MKKRSNQHEESSIPGSILDHVEELPKLRKIRVILARIERQILNRSPSLQILAELGRIRECTSLLETRVWENHLRGCFKKAVAEEDEREVEETVQKLASYISRREEEE